MRRGVVALGVLLALLPIPARALSVAPQPCRPADVPGVLECDVPVPADLGSIDGRVRVVLPDGYHAGLPAPVVYLLHGVADSYRTWTDKTDVESFARSFGAIVVMPDAGSGTEAGWYSNWRDGSRDWETFHTRVLVHWVEATFHTLGAGHRAVIGVSMGGFGAMKYAARHPGLFAAAASISGLLDTQLYGPAEGWVFRVGRGTDGYTLGTPDDRVWGDPLVNRDIWTAHNPTALAGDGKLDALTDRLWVRTGTGAPTAAPPDPANVDGHLVEQVVWQTNQSFGQAVGDGIDYADAAGTHDWPFHEAFLHEVYGKVVAAIS